MRETDLRLRINRQRSGLSEDKDENKNSSIGQISLNNDSHEHDSLRPDVADKLESGAKRELRARGGSRDSDRSDVAASTGNGRLKRVSRLNRCHLENGHKKAKTRRTSAESARENAECENSGPEKCKSELCEPNDGRSNKKVRRNKRFKTGRIDKKRSDVEIASHKTADRNLRSRRHSGSNDRSVDDLEPEFVENSGIEVSFGGRRSSVSSENLGGASSADRPFGSAVRLPSDPVSVAEKGDRRDSSGVSGGASVRLSATVRQPSGGLRRRPSENCDNNSSVSYLDVENNSSPHKISVNNNNNNNANKIHVELSSSNRLSGEGKSESFPSEGPNHNNNNDDDKLRVERERATSVCRTESKPLSSRSDGSNSPAKDVYEFDDDEIDSASPCTLRGAKSPNANGWNGAVNGVIDPSAGRDRIAEKPGVFGVPNGCVAPRSLPATPAKPSRDGLKLRLRMKRSPVLDEVIETGSHLSDPSCVGYEPEYEVLTVEGIHDSDYHNNDYHHTNNHHHHRHNHHRKQKKHRKRDSYHGRNTVSDDGSFLPPSMKRLRLILGDETRTITIPPSE